MILSSIMTYVLIMGILYALLTYPFRWLARVLPGKSDTALAIVRKPILVIAGLAGFATVFGLPQLGDTIAVDIGRALDTLLIIVLVYTIWRLIADIVLPSARFWAERTESKLTVAIPVVDLFGPLLTILFGALLILPQWGVDISSILLGAGVIGIVLGIALQDSLSNLFSGISLLADAPFKPGDLISLPDGKNCKVEKIGIRTTQLDYLEQHSTIYVPNSDLANATIQNITKPTVDLRVSIPIGVAYDSDWEHVEEILLAIAQEHPNVLLSDIDKKIQLLQQVVGRGGTEGIIEHERYEKTIERLRKEILLNNDIVRLSQAFKTLGMTLDAQISQKSFKQPLKEQCHSIDGLVDNTCKRMREWSEIPDQWAEPEEQQYEVTRWTKQNQRLIDKWGLLRRALLRTRFASDGQSTLNRVNAITAWLNQDYKIVTLAWKDPVVAFCDLGPSSIDLVLNFYVDDIRLSHAERKQRVVTAIAKGIVKRFREADPPIEIPFPQTDIRFRDLWLQNAVAKGAPVPLARDEKSEAVSEQKA
jgi:MscS family membrane protein